MRAQGLREWNQSPCKETQRVPLPVLPHEGRECTGLCATCTRAFLRMRPCWCPHLEFQAPRTRRSKLLLFKSFPSLWHLIVAAQTDKGRLELNLSRDWQKLFSQIQPYVLNGWSLVTYKRFKERRIMKHHWVKLCGSWVIFVCVRYHPERNHSSLVPKNIWRQQNDSTFFPKEFS